MGIEPYYEEDGITIYHGDCRDILPQLEPVDLVLTDPPYGIGESSKKHESRGKICRAGGHNSGHITVGGYGQSNWDDKPIAMDLINLTITKAKQCIIFGGNYYSLPTSSCWLVWDKDNGASHFADCELAWTNLKQAVRMIKYRWNGMLQEPGKPRETRVHPTQKPTHVLKWCISQADKHGKINTILDPYMGSGTTLVAAKNLGRKAIGIEIEEKYCEIAVKRLAQGVLAL